MLRHVVFDSIASLLAGTCDILVSPNHGVGGFYPIELAIRVEDYAAPIQLAVYIPNSISLTLADPILNRFSDMMGAPIAQSCSVESASAYP